MLKWFDLKMAFNINTFMLKWFDLKMAFCKFYSRCLNN
jgi:hypothetical protein